MNKRKVLKLISINLVIVMWSLTGWPAALINPSLSPAFAKVEAAVDTFTTAGTANWLAPAGVATITVEAWGGGGGGGTRTSAGGTGGGGGGAYVISTGVAVTAGNNYSYTVGAAGTTGNPTGVDGGDSSFTTVVIAKGGKTVNANVVAGGAGGLASASTGGTKRDGGSGATSAGNGMGGGGSGGTSANGTTATTSTGAVAVAGGGPGGNGGSSGNAVGTAPASGPGGGGGGGRRASAGTSVGGNGWAGQIKITYPIVSVSVADATVAYGSVALNTSVNTTSGGLNDTQVATNNGDMAEDFNIKGADTAAWTLSGSAGSNQYVHAFCITGSGSPDPCDATPTWTALTTSYQALANNLAAAGTKRFDLRITTPTTTSSGAQQTATVTVQAVQH